MKIFNKENINYCGILLMIVNIFFSMVNLDILVYFQLFSIGLLLCLLTMDFQKIRIDKKIYFLLLILLLFFITALHAWTDHSSGYCTRFFTGIITAFAIANSSNKNKKRTLDTIKIFSIVFMFFTYFSLIFPMQYEKMISVMFNSNNYEVIMGLYDFRGFSGIAGQTGNNAFLLSIGLVVMVLDLILNTNNKKGSNILSMITIVLLMFAVVLTNKRFFLVVIFFIIFFSIIIYCKKNKLTKKTLMVLLLLFTTMLITTFYIYNRFPVFQRISNSNNFLNGRDTLYNIAISLIEGHPYLGIGINNYINYSNVGGVVYYAHNVFLQLAAEIGIPFSVIVVLILIAFFGDTYKKSNSKMDNDKKRILYYSTIAQGIFLLYFFTGNSLYDTNMLMFYFMVLGLSLALVPSKKKRDAL